MAGDQCQRCSPAPAHLRTAMLPPARRSNSSNLTTDGSAALLLRWTEYGTRCQGGHGDLADNQMPLVNTTTVVSGANALCRS